MEIHDKEDTTNKEKMQTDNNESILPLITEDDNQFGIEISAP
jgi:hypothetical protein